MLRPVAPDPHSGVRRVSHKGKIYCRCADIAAIVPDSKIRGAVCKLYRDKFGGIVDMILVPKSPALYWGWYIVETHQVDFASFIDDVNNQREAIDAGVRIGIAVQRNTAQAEAARLTEEVVTLQEENAALRQRISQLEDQLHARPKIRVRVPMRRIAA